MKKVLKIVSILVVFALLGSCVDDDDNMNVINGPTALDFLKESPDHSMMVEALERTQLDFDLDQEGSLTVFAPTDAAFNVYLAGNGFGSINDIPVDDLRTILSYHIQSGIRSIEQFNSQYYKTQAQVANTQMDVYVLNTSNVITINNEATVTSADNRLSNAIIHVVDNVLDLPSIFTLIAANPNFSNLTTALSQEGLNLILGDNANATAPFTLFAPNNDAFAGLIAADDMDNLNTFQDVLDQNNFDDKLRYHVLGSQRLRLNDFEDGAVVNPLGTGTFITDTNSGVKILDGSGQTINLISTNITAFNGVVHILDFVLRQ